MRLAITILFLLELCAFGDFTNVVPRKRFLVDYFGTNWQGVQVDKVNKRLTVTNMTLIDNTGASDVSAAIQAALNINWNLGAGTAAVINLPAGMYRLDNGLKVYSNEILKGAGRTTTILSNTAAGLQFIEIGTDHNFASNTITSGFTFGSSNITVPTAADSRYTYSVGDVIFITQENDTNFMAQSSPSNGTNLMGLAGIDMGFTAIITALASSPPGTNISFWPPLLYSLRADLHPQVLHWFGTTSNAGVESVTINGQSNATTTYAVLMHEHWNTWLDDLKIEKFASHGILVAKGTEWEVTRVALDSVGGAVANTGVGVEVWEHNSFWKVEHCSTWRMYSPFMIVDNSAMGAMLYNYCGNDTGSGSQVAGDLFLNHGKGAIYTLWEGNHGSHAHADFVHGSSAMTVLYRNYIEGRIAESPGSTNNLGAFCVSFDTMNYSNGVVGNILGSPGFPVGTGGGVYFTSNQDYTISMIYRLGFPNPGNPSTAGTHPPDWTGNQWDLWSWTNGGFADGVDINIRKGNYVLGSANPYTNQVPAVESIGSTNLQASLFYQAKPALFSNWAWPPMGPDVATLTNIIPAEAWVWNIAQPGGGNSGSTNRTGRIRRIHN